MIPRDPTSACANRYDLIVVGGGIYGVALTLEAARRGMTPLLVERGDFGQHTSWNSLRIVHGGLRYLQTLDLPRFFESVNERRWLLRHFPDLIEPLPCLMPLYGDGLRRPSVFRIALKINDLLSAKRNREVRPDRALPGGRVISTAETVSLFPAVDRQGLCGGALWHDAVMPDSQRLLVEMLRWACELGATALNYAEAGRILTDEGRVTGLACTDAITGRLLKVRAPVVVNCAGPWCREVSGTFDRDVPRLFLPSLAFNVLIDRAPIFQVGVAVRPKRPGAPTYFLYPWRGRMLAGTHHATWAGKIDDAPPDDALVDWFLGDLSQAIPGFDVRPEEVMRVYRGLLPAARTGSTDLAVREVVYDHGAQGGPGGLYSVSGVKFTTARLVAEKTLQLVHTGRGARLPELMHTEPPRITTPPTAEEFRGLLADDPEAARALASRLVSDESVQRLEDLMLRRTDWGVLENDGKTIAARIGDLIGPRK